MNAAEVPDELVEAALKAALPVGAFDLERGLAEQEYRDALAAVLPLYGAKLVDGALSLAAEELRNEMDEPWGFRAATRVESFAARLRAAETERTS